MTSIEDTVHHEFAQLLELQPYTVVIDSLVITVEEDVFPPDLGQRARNLAKVCAEYRPRRALDMGCGSGYLALALKQQGVPDVWALDAHEPAVACTRKNLEQNAARRPDHCRGERPVRRCPAVDRKFDLVVFNQPFAPAAGDAVCGCGSDGGYRSPGVSSSRPNPASLPEAAP